jgi:uncharacterized protein with HEPN domain
MNKDDLVRIRHMLDAAQDAVSFAQGHSRENLETNRMLTFALLRAIEIIGEAASRVTNESREANPQLPWLQIVGMRNRLIHAYFDVDLDRVWKTTSEETPSLVVQLEGILSAQKTDDSEGTVDYDSAS